jgi:hypothetical protein
MTANRYATSLKNPRELYQEVELVVRSMDKTVA